MNINSNLNQLSFSPIVVNEKKAEKTALEGQRKAEELAKKAQQQEEKDAKKIEKQEEKDAKKIQHQAEQVAKKNKSDKAADAGISAEEPSPNEYAPGSLLARDIAVSIQEETTGSDVSTTLVSHDAKDDTVEFTELPAADQGRATIFEQPTSGEVQRNDAGPNGLASVGRSSEKTSVGQEEDAQSPTVIPGHNSNNQNSSASASNGNEGLGRGGSHNPTDKPDTLLRPIHAAGNERSSEKTEQALRDTARAKINVPQANQYAYGQDRTQAVLARFAEERNGISALRATPGPEGAKRNTPARVMPSPRASNYQMGLSVLTAAARQQQDWLKQGQFNPQTNNSYGALGGLRPSWGSSLSLMGKHVDRAF